MVVKYTIGKAENLLQNMIVRIWESHQKDDPDAFVFEEIVPERDAGGTPDPGGGHNVEYLVTANGLEPVVHTVRTFAAVSGELLNQYEDEPKADIISIFDPIRFKIGDGGPNTPVAGTNNYQNDLLEGLGDEDYEVFRNGYGILFPNLHYTTDSLTGTWAFTGEDVFGEIEEIVIKRKSRTISSVINDSVVGKNFKSVYDITANIVFDSATHLRKLLRFQGQFNFTFDVGQTPPKFYGFCFQNFAPGAAGEKGIVKFLNKPLLWNGAPKTQIDIPIFTEACFIFDGDYWNVVYLCTTQQPPVGPGEDFLPGQTIGVGFVALGNIAAGDLLFTVTHNKNIIGDYVVFLSLMGSAATHGQDNNCIAVWYHHATEKANKFMLAPNELYAGLQNLTIYYQLVKI